MNSVQGICIVLLVSLSIVVASPNIKERANVGAWIPIDWRTLPKANAGKDRSKKVN